MMNIRLIAVAMSVLCLPNRLHGLASVSKDNQQRGVPVVREDSVKTQISGGDAFQHWGEEASMDAVQSRIKRSDDYGSLAATLEALTQEVTSLQAQLQATNNALQSVTASQGSTYIRWGRTACPQQAQLVYTGRAAGSYRETTGGSPNRLCLPMTPQFDDVENPSYYGRVFGAEYLQISSHHGLVAPCAVCHVTQGSSIMVPGTLTCPASWQSQYTGHLTSEDHNHASIAEYVCLDGSPEDVAGSSSSDGAATYFYYTVYACGSLPCPPYTAGRVVTCVVCSK